MQRNDRVPYLAFFYKMFKSNAFFIKNVVHVINVHLYGKNSLDFTEHSLFLEENTY